MSSKTIENLIRWPLAYVLFLFFWCAGKTWLHPYELSQFSMVEKMWWFHNLIWDGMRMILESLSYFLGA